MEDEPTPEAEPSAPRSTPDAATLLQAPAVGILVTALLNAAFWGLATVGNVLAYFFAHGSRGPNQEETLGHGLGLLVTVFLVVLSLVLAYGAGRMKALKGYGLAVVTSVLILLPIVSICCPLGLPFGIWALVLLARRDVREAFR